jgi:hypothetical protein
LRTKSVVYNGRDCLMVYITKQERQDEHIMHKIDLYKDRYDTAIFVSGDRDIKEVITNMIKEKM